MSFPYCKDHTISLHSRTVTTSNSHGESPVANKIQGFQGRAITVALSQSILQSQIEGMTKIAGIMLKTKHFLAGQRHVLQAVFL